MEKNLTNYYKDFVLKLEDGNTQTYSSRASNRGGTIKFLFWLFFCIPSLWNLNRVASTSILMTLATAVSLWVTLVAFFAWLFLLYLLNFFYSD